MFTLPYACIFRIVCVATRNATSESKGEELVPVRERASTWGGVRGWRVGVGYGVGKRGGWRGAESEEKQSAKRYVADKKMENRERGCTRAHEMKTLFESLSVTFFFSPFFYFRCGCRCNPTKHQISIDGTPLNFLIPAWISENESLVETTRDRPGAREHRTDTMLTPAAHCSTI